MYCAIGFIFTKSNISHRNGESRKFLLISMCADSSVHSAVDQDDLPICAVFLENNAVRALYLTCTLDHVVEPRPTTGVPVIGSEVRDAQFPWGIRREDSVHPYRSQKMMSVFIEPDGILRD